MIVKEWPTLFKKSSTGKIQTWQIHVEEIADGTGAICVLHGQIGGKLQEGADFVKEGKNLGKANATTAVQQAVAEAEAKWTKQKKKRYVESQEAAQAGEVDDVIEGGIDVMLAPSKIYPVFAAKLMWPVFDQPKLDGSRCIAIVENGVCTLWSRTRKRINSVPHIERACETLVPKEGRYVLDGELYADQFAEDFEELMSLVRKDEPAPGHEKVEYWVYDYPSCEATFKARSTVLWKLFLAGGADTDKVYMRIGPLVRVPTYIANNDPELRSHHADNIEAGFEGTMVRNDGPYEGGKRSYHLQKLKDMQDAEADIVGAVEGRGKDVGTVGCFQCLTIPEGVPFDCRLKSSYARRRELFEHPEQWQGMKLTYKFQNLTADRKPRFPIGKGLRRGTE